MPTFRHFFLVQLRHGAESVRTAKGVTGYAVEFHIPTEHFMSSLTKVSSTTRARHRAWIRRYARGVWRAAVGAGAYHLDRFMCLVGIQWPGESIFGPAAALETAKPIIDAATDTCDPQGRHLLIEDDDPSHRVMTAYYTVPGTSAYGVTLYVSMIPLSPGERMPSGVVDRFEAGTLKGYTAEVSIPDGTWMTSNHRLDPEERELRMEKTMALSYDMWKDKPALGGNVGVFSSISFPNLNYLGDVDNAECIVGLLEGAAVLGKLPRKIEMMGFMVSHKEAPKHHHDVELLVLQAPEGTFWPSVLSK